MRNATPPSVPLPRRWLLRTRPKPPSQRSTKRPKREYEYHSKGGHYEAHDKAAHKINDKVVYDRDLTEKDGQISGAEHKFGIEGDKTAATKQLKDTKDTRI